MKLSCWPALLLPVALMAPCLHAPGESTPPAAPADGGVILFASNRDGDFEIYRINPDGSELRQLTNNQAEDTSPSCSPDGKTIAFVSTRSGSRAIFVMAAEGEARKIADNAGEGTHISWAPDGRRLVCDLQFGTRIDIYVMNADGTEPKELVQDGMMPDWSPDGTTIAFNRGNTPHIFLMDADGGNVRPLRTGGSLMPELYPLWSPDGKTILFSAVSGVEKDSAGAQKMTYDIRTVTAEGGTSKSILKTGGMALCWSPDGTKVMLMSMSDDDTELYIMTVGETELTSLAKSPLKEMWGCWARSNAPDHAATADGATSKPSAP